MLCDLTRPVSGSTQTNADNGIGVIAMFEMSQAFSPYAGLRRPILRVLF
jgi:hypothetical protein